MHIIRYNHISFKLLHINKNPPPTRYLNKLGNDGPFHGAPRSICDSICDWTHPTQMCPYRTLVNSVQVHSFRLLVLVIVSKKVQPMLPLAVTVGWAEMEKRPRPGWRSDYEYAPPRHTRRDDYANSPGLQPSTKRCPRHGRRDNSVECKVCTLHIALVK
jgi:hypothetical protein